MNPTLTGGRVASFAKHAEFESLIQLMLLKIVQFPGVRRSCLRLLEKELVELGSRARIRRSSFVKAKKWLNSKQAKVPACPVSLPPS